MKRSFGLIFIVIFVILILGGIYCYRTSVETQKSNQHTELAPQQAEPQPENNTDTQKDFEIISEKPQEQIPLKKTAQKIDGLEIPLCPKNALTITAQNSQGVLDTPEKEDSHQIISHAGYTLCYREKYEQPEWVCYTLTPEKTVKTTDRKDNFRPDPKVITGSATLSDYKKSGYDRGHLAPIADMTYSEITMDESFFLSNMSPQTSDLNRGLWKELEQTIRDFTEDFEKLWIVTGPVLEKNDFATIGKNEVSVPEYYYKAILGKKSQELFMIGFILPNEKCEGTVWDYVVSIDEIEERTGLDFFYRLQDEKLENTLDVSAWKK